MAQNGRPAWQVFLQFFDFAKSAIWVGHNTGLFDIKMIKAHARRLNLTIPSFVWIDTLDVAHRFIRADNYRLETLAEQLKLTKPSHRADDDVITTVGLLAHLIPMLEADSSTRKSLVNRYGEPFIPLAQQLERWRQLSEQLRPAQLLSRVIEESGLYRAYDHEPERQKHLNTLVALFQERDNPDLHPETALRALVEFSALAKNVDHLSESDNKVPIITVHQAKGLEFDTVFIAGAAEGEFPNYYSIRDNNLEEEKRLFYVALTRAREKVAITAPSVNEWGRENPLSRFIGSINKRYINQSGAGFGEEPQSILRESRNSYRP